jgi:hypothetical protein
VSSTNYHPERSTSPDAIDVAKIVNASWGIARRRLAAEARNPQHVADSDQILARLDRLERDIEAIVAALAERAP